MFNLNDIRFMVLVLCYMMFSISFKKNQKISACNRLHTVVNRLHGQNFAFIFTTFTWARDGYRLQDSINRLHLL